MNIYGLIGYPLGHSFSKKYFTEKFKNGDHKDCLFELFPLKDISLFPDLIGHDENIKGLAVTIPYKESVISYLDHLDEQAFKIKAVNCIKFDGKILTGYNTDSDGFEESFLPLLKDHHSAALVLGSGGSSRAIQYVLSKNGLPYLVITSKKTIPEGMINYAAINKSILREYPVIINCTPVGMTPDEQNMPLLPYDLLNEKNLLYDLIYTPAQTLFLKNGLERGAEIKNGYEMLVLQAEKNWHIWNS